MVAGRDGGRDGWRERMEGGTEGGAAAQGGRGCARRREKGRMENDGAGWREDKTFSSRSAVVGREEVTV